MENMFHLGLERKRSAHSCHLLIFCKNNRLLLLQKLTRHPAELRALYQSRVRAALVQLQERIEALQPMKEGLRGQLQLEVRLVQKEGPSAPEPKVVPRVCVPPARRLARTLHGACAAR